MVLAELGMRFSPTKTNILLRKNALGDDILRKKDAGELATHQIGINTAKGPAALPGDHGIHGQGGDYTGDEEEDIVRDGDEILVDDYGRPLIDRHIAFLPDPRYQEWGHLAFCLLWYGGCIASILYIYFVFAAYTPEVTQTLPFTSEENPRVILRLEISCSSPTVTITRTNYSDPSSPCFNDSSIHVPGPLDVNETGHVHNTGTLNGNRRGFATQAHHLPAAFNPQPPPVQWLKADGPAPLVTGNNYTTAETIEIPICYVPDTNYDSNWYWPEFPGVAVMFGNISQDELCSIDVFTKGLTGVAGMDSEKPIKRLSVEGQVLKTLFVRYDKVRTQVGEEDPVLAREGVSPVFYELDGQRTFAGGDTSIVRFRFTDVSNSLLEFDMRTRVKAGGIFGSLWYMVSNYFCFYAAPLLMCLWPRNFIADAKAGKLDGYTKNALENCWRPTVWLWIGGELVKRVGFAVGP